MIFQDSGIYDTFTKKKISVLELKNGRLQSILEENYDKEISEYGEELACKFWDFIKYGESENKEDYFEIKKKYFKKLGLTKEFIANSTSAEIADEIKLIILKKIFSDYMVGDEPINTIHYLLDYILESQMTDVNYNVLIQRTPIGFSKDTYQVNGEIDINKEKEHKSPKINVKYDYISKFKFKQLSPVEYENLSIEDYIFSEVDIKYGDDKIYFTFIYNGADPIVDAVLESMIAKTSVSFFQIKETWEEYLYQSFQLFNEGKYSTSFLVAFSAMDSLIEFIICCFNEYIESLNIELIFSDDSTKASSNLSVNQNRLCSKTNFSSKEDQFWRSQYVELMKEKRRLVDEKLRQILEIIRDVLISENFMNEKDAFQNDSIFSKIRTNLFVMEKIRNRLAHGNKVSIKEEDKEQLNLELEEEDKEQLNLELEEEDKEQLNLEDYPKSYIKLYTTLLISFANIISLFNGREFFNYIEARGIVESYY